MGSTIDYMDCPYCHSEDSYIVDYYYKRNEEFCFCEKCGSHHNVYIKRDEEDNYVYGKPNYFAYGKMLLHAAINDADITCVINNKEELDIYFGHIQDFKAFRNKFQELCDQVCDYILAHPENYKAQIEDYHRGCFSDGSGDKDSVDLAHRASYYVTDENNNRMYYIYAKLDYDDNGVAVSYLEYETDEFKGYGTFTVKGKDDDVSAIHVFESVPDEDTINKLKDDENVVAISVFENDKITVIKEDTQGYGY